MAWFSKFKLLFTFKRFNGGGWFSKFTFLFALKVNFNGCQFYKEISKFGSFKKVEKVILSWSGWLYWLLNVLSKFAHEKIEWWLGYQKSCSWVIMYGGKSRFKDCLQQKINIKCSWLVRISALFYFGNLN